jgi:hypothetical protein
MALFDRMGGLLGNLGDYGFGLPSNTGGLVADEDRDAINKRALLSGLISAGLTYAATPQNLNTGSALPYLGRAGLAGFGASQDVIDRSLNTAYRNKLIAGRDDNIRTYESDRKKITEIYDPVTKETKRYESPLDAPREDKSRYTDAYGNISFTKFGTDNPSALTPAQRMEVDAEVRRRAGGGLGLKDIYGEPQKDASGNLVYVPKVPGYPIRDISGKPVAGNIQLKEKDAKPATESQAKAATFYSQMTSASDELRKLQQEGFDPSSPISQTAVSLAGTPLRGIAGQQAQRAKQIQEQWAEAFLRIKTGAAAQKQEVKLNIETFFPKFGETDPQIIAQKERARQQAEQDVLRMTKEGGGSVGAKPKELSAQDKQALDWANSNATDPRAAQIKQRLGL